MPGAGVLHKGAPRQRQTQDDRFTHLVRLRVAGVGSATGAGIPSRPTGMLEVVMSRWRSDSRSIRWAAAVLAIVLFYGTAVHVFQFIGSGLSAYPGLPGWLRTYFIALVVLDPLAAFLVVLRRRSGVALAVAVLTTDAVANGWAGP